jgi:hypothetical protein
VHQDARRVLVGGEVDLVAGLEGQVGDLVDRVVERAALQPTLRTTAMWVVPGIGIASASRSFALIVLPASSKRYGFCALP